MIFRSSCHEHPSPAADTRNRDATAGCGFSLLETSLRKSLPVIEFLLEYTLWNVLSLRVCCGDVVSSALSSDFFVASDNNDNMLQSRRGIEMSRNS